MPPFNRELLDFIGDDVDLAKTCIREVCKQRDDKRAALRAAGIIIDHQRALYEHDNPSKQLHAFDNELNIKIKFDDKPGEVKHNGDESRI